MALRVLLADESSTIKKVMQLALQDFGVEVKAVPIGLDVLQVARSFMPDIIFADVLLSKKNGYEVSGELKADPIAKKIPVVLMWSGFMEIDEAKAQASGAERRLEKPFDADTLRSLIKDLCPVVNTNVISEFLTFPEMPSIVEKPTQNHSQSEKQPQKQMQDQFQKQDQTGTAIPSSPLNSKQNSARSAPVELPEEPEFEEFQFEVDEPADDFSVNEDSVIEDIEEPEEFQSIPLPKNQGLPVPPKAKSTLPRDDWARQDLSRYKIELPQDEDFTLDEADLSRTTSIALSTGLGEISLDQLDDAPSFDRSLKPGKSSNSSKTFGQPSDFQSANLSSSLLNTLDPMRIEELLRQEARSVMENIAWKIIPEIVERVVREELQKLLKDAERL